MLPAYRLAGLCMYKAAAITAQYTCWSYLGATSGLYLLGMRSVRNSSLLPLQVARQADLGTNDETYFVRTHLGNLLHAGDTAVG